jgi:exodeoxyribonuclease V beta subunit
VTLAHPAFASLDAPTLVEASAGTGKTYTITTYFVRGIIEQGYEPKQILVVTYTKAATADLRKRARERIVEALARLDGPSGKADLLDEILPAAIAEHGRETVEQRLRSALASMDQSAILTIHGFCQRLLQDHPLAFGIDFEFEVSEDLAPIYGELATDYWASELYDKPAWLVHALRAKGLRTTHLAKLAERALFPRVPLLGPEPVEADEALVERALEARRTAGTLWLAHRDEVQQILLNDDGLNRGRYQKKSLPRWFKDLDAFAKQDGLRELPDFMGKLAQNGIIVKTNYEPPQHVFFEACQALVEAFDAVAPMLDFAVFDFQRGFLEVAEAEVRRRREETGILSYDDLLTIVHDQVVADPALASRIASEYRLALVDEFQDTDSVQYEIFKAAYGNGSCVYVGDPKQAIYAFRGADVYSYITAARDVGDRELSLDTNRRSDPAMVHAVNLVFGQRNDPFMLDRIGFADVTPHEPEARSTLEPALDFVWIDEGTLKTPGAPIAKLAANEVAHLLRSDAKIEGRPIQPGDIAVLCRSNAKARDVTKALRELGVPTSLEGDSSVLSTDIARAMRAVLQAALTPGDSRAVRRALLTPLLGVTPRALVEMNDEEWTSWVTKFQSWHELWREYGVVRFVEEMLRDGNAEARIAATPTAKRELTDLLHVEELLMRGERERQRDPIALMQWLRRLEEGSPDEGMVRSEDLQQRPDAESGAVRITTIHKSKGLEYGVVFCPFTWSDANLFEDEKKALKFHDAEDTLRIDLGSANCEAHEDKAQLEKLSEALRVLYVALTRAKHRCTVFWGRNKGWYGTALGWLLHGGEAAKALDEAALRAELEALSARSDGAIGCRGPALATAQPLSVDPPKHELAALVSKRGYDLSPRIASFSSLTGHDEKAPASRPGDDDEPTRPPLFQSLPGGTRTGLLLHSILEHASFNALGEGETDPSVERHLMDYGFGTSLAPEIQRDLGVVVSTPLLQQNNAPTLARLGPELRELEFTLALDWPSIGDLASLLERHGAPANMPSYPARLRGLRGQSMTSFLRGFIDLVFEWEGRWYVADYKSNSLPSYTPDAVSEAVQREHYVLQALLYSVAAARYLRQRVDGFDPAQHWGGAMFLFLRGMGGPEAPGASVFFDPQSPELLLALDEWLGGADGRG